MLDLKKIRQAISDYMYSEGCSCCGDYEEHRKHRATLGKLLKVRPFSDGSGYDFSKYRTKTKPTEGEKSEGKNG